MVYGPSTVTCDYTEKKGALTGEGNPKGTEAETNPTGMASKAGKLYSEMAVSQLQEMPHLVSYFC